MSSLKEQLIKLGNTNPELREHITPVLNKIAASNLVDVIADFLWHVADQTREIACEYTRWHCRGTVGSYKLFQGKYPAYPITFYQEVVDEYGDFEETDNVIGTFMIYIQDMRYIVLSPQGREVVEVNINVDKHKASTDIGKAIAAFLK